MKTEEFEILTDDELYLLVGGEENGGNETEILFDGEK